MIYIGFGHLDHHDSFGHLDHHDSKRGKSGQNIEELINGNLKLTNILWRCLKKPVDSLTLKTHK